MVVVAVPLYPHSVYFGNKIPETPNNVEPSEFDPPMPGLGTLFSVSRGLLQAANIHDDLLTGNVVAADGRTNFGEALREFHMAG
ncbi:MAG: hypothetical protein Q7N50_03125 [Armatimonadota bacterium]|nr:hypothetical protein [Armatimonadota bacterium]